MYDVLNSGILTSEATFTMSMDSDLKIEELYTFTQLTSCETIITEKMYDIFINLFGMNTFNWYQYYP